MFYLLDKEKGISSFAAIKKFARENNISKIGHTGTLDPLATGLLLIATDDDTKLIEYVDKGFKTYKATMLIGKKSDTYDSEGEIIEGQKFIGKKQEIIDLLKSFEGIQEQFPPAYSAKKINGKKAYELARAGEKVKLKSSKITIKDISHVTFVSNEIISFVVVVSRGTYIRSLIHDFGLKLGTGAIMIDLDRTSIGELDKKMVGKTLNSLELITLPIIKTNYMKNLVDGKRVEADEDNGLYALEYKNDIFGIVLVKNKILIAKKLLGNKFRKEGF